MSLSSSATMISLPRARRRNENDVRHVRAEVDLAEMLEVGGRVAVDRRAGGRDVELAAVRAHHETHARPAVELRLAQHSARIEIERPELIVAGLAVNAVGALAIRRQAEAHGLTRPERIKV